MAWFRRKPNESQIELAVLRAALLARAQEGDTSRLASDTEIATFLDFAFREMKLRPNASHTEIATISVQALLSQKEFLTELSAYQEAHPGDPLPTEFRSKMLAAIQQVVAEYQVQSKPQR